MEQAKWDVRLEVERVKERWRERAGGKGPRVPLVSVVVGVVLVVLVVAVCLLALVGQHQADRRGPGRRRAHHTDPHFTQSILLGRLARHRDTVLEAPETGLSDIFISVKTSQKFHKSRLGVVLATWFQQARASTFFFTDSADAETAALAGGHLVPTPCAEDHSRQALCCKMQAELDLFLQSDRRWVTILSDPPTEGFVTPAAPIVPRVMAGTRRGQAAIWSLEPRVAMVSGPASSAGG
jgi:hypothetical protein